MQSPYFSPNWVEAAKPIWEGSLEESSSATLLGIGMSSLLPGVDCNCHWMERAPQKWSAFVVCWGYVDASSYHCYSTISHCRQDEMGDFSCLRLLGLFLQSSVALRGQWLLYATELCTHQNDISLTNRPLFSIFCLYPIFFWVASVLSCPWRIA